MTAEQKRLVEDIRSKYPIGSIVQINAIGAVVINHVLAKRYDEDIAFITVAHPITGDWFNCDPQLWGL